MHSPFEIDPVAWSRPGVVTWMNKSSKKALIFYSNNCLKSLAYRIDRLTKDYITNDLFSQDIELVLTEADSHDEAVVVHGWISEEMLSQGYTLLNPKYSKFEVVIEAYKFDRRIRAAAVLRSATKRIIVGLFDTVVEAKDFIDTNYNHKEIFHIDRAKNVLTKRYLLSRKV